MNINIYKYNLIISNPSQKKKIEYNLRQGFILKISDNQYFGLGEASPLPGYSKETLEEVKKELLALPEIIKNFKINNNLLLLNGNFEKQLTKYKLKPSTRFAFESAVLNLIANRQNFNLSEILKKKQSSVRINALIRSNVHEVEEEIKHLLDEKYSCFKLKINHNNSINKNKLKLLQETIAPSNHIRLDFNQKLKIKDSLLFVNSIDNQQIEYIEEPVQNIQNLQKFNNESQVNFALDESLASMKNALYVEKTTIPLIINNNKHLTTLILKPTILGLENAILWANFAYENNLKAILTATYESGIAIQNLIQVSSILKSDFFGFDTYRWFQEDTLENSLQIKQGKISITDFSYQLNNNKLEQIL